MEATIKITIELPIDFEIDDDDVEIISIDEDLAIDLINAELKTNESKNALIYEANEAGKEWESDRAEHIFMARRDAR